MQYSLERASTMAACDALLVFAQKEKQDLERRRRNLGEAIENLRERIDLLGREYIRVQSLLKAYMTAYHILPEGSKDKLSMNVDVKKLELRQARLDKKGFTCNVRTLLAKEVYYNKLDSQVSALESFIIAVQRRKMTLEQAVLRVNLAANSLRPPASRQKALHGKKKQGFFSMAAAVHQKRQPEKNVYSFPGRFSAPCDCTCKMDTCEKHVQFSSA